MDIVRNYKWPEGYTARALNNLFLRTWRGRESELEAASDIEVPKWKDAWDAGNVDDCNVFISESVGLIKSIDPAAEIIARMVAQAIQQLQTSGKLIRH
jgi:nitronate monooxygenase